jgi:hypothetical protein
LDMESIGEKFAAGGKFSRKRFSMQRFNPRA